MDAMGYLDLNQTGNQPKTHPLQLPDMVRPPGGGGGPVKAALGSSAEREFHEKKTSLSV